MDYSVCQLFFLGHAYTCLHMPPPQKPRPVVLPPGSIFKPYEERERPRAQFTIRDPTEGASSAAAGAPAREGGAAASCPTPAAAAPVPLEQSAAPTPDPLEQRFRQIQAWAFAQGRREQEYIWAMECQRRQEARAARMIRMEKDASSKASGGRPVPEAAPKGGAAAAKGASSAAPGASRSRSRTRNT